MQRRGLGGRASARIITRATAATVAEAMERRRLLSAVLGADGTLSVNGTAGADQISVHVIVKQANAPLMLEVAVNQEAVKDFPASSVLRLVTNGGDGGDTIDQNLSSPLDDYNPPTTVNGGPGDDSISVLQGMNVVNGGAGNDAIQFGHETDTLNGDAGDDTFSLHDGINGVDSRITINGGDGSDTLLSSIDTTHVIYSGGNGTDTADYHNSGSSGFPSFDVSLDGVTNDGPGRNDNVGTDVETVIGAGRQPNHLVGNGAANRLVGGLGADTIAGAGGNDTVLGGDGDDTLDGGTGSDSVSGGNGQDTVSGGGGGTDVVNGGPGWDVVNGVSEYTGTPAALGAEGTLIVTGTEDEDQIKVMVDVAAEGDGSGTVSVRANGVTQNFTAPAVKGIVVNALGAADMVSVNGTDSVTGGSAGLLYINSSIFGGDGNDQITAGVFDPMGNGPSDYVDGGAGNDDLRVFHDGNATIVGGDGDDTFLAGGDAGLTVRVLGGNGDDFLTSNETTNYALYDGGAGSNTFYCADSLSPALLKLDMKSSFLVNVHTVVAGDKQTVLGTDGADHLIGPSGSVTLDGRGGDDVIDVTATVAVVNGGDGADSIIADVYQATLSGGNGNDTISAGAFNPLGPLVLNGDAGNDRMTVRNSESPASLFGGTGSDTMSGGLEADRFSGGSGIDTVDYSARSAKVTVGVGTFADDGEAGEGDNVLTDNEIVLGGSAADCLKGNSGDDQLYGNGGDDILLGLGGADSLFGGGGNDRLDGGAGADFMRGGDGTGDTVDYSSRTAGVIVGIGVYADDGEPGEKDNVYQDIERVLGGSGNDSIKGNAGANVLFGNGGRDSLEGGGGVDAMFGGIGDDLIRAKDGLKDFIDGGAGADSAVTDLIEDVVNVEMVTH